MNEFLAAILTLSLTAITGYVYMRVLRSKKTEASSDEIKSTETITLDKIETLEFAYEGVAEGESSSTTKSDKYGSLESQPIGRRSINTYITNEEPFGPIDSTDIDLRDVNALEMLFEHHNRIYDGLRNRPSIIMGRKGSGKTSYLRTVFFDKKYDYFTEIRTAHVIARISKIIQGTTGEAVFPEVLAELWEMVLWICVLSEFRKLSLLPQDKVDLVNVYLERIGVSDTTNVDDVLWKLADVFDQIIQESPNEGVTEILRRLDRLAFDNVMLLVMGSLKTANKKFVILMDSLDDFQLDIDSVARSLQGLLKFIGSMNKPRDVVDIRFCLPTELYRRIIKISSNPNKDFRRSLKLQWTASELTLIGAQRLKIFLELYYPSYLKKLLPLDPTRMVDALELFNAVLPKTITNQGGFQEETLSYILRHTQLLPRHFLMLLNSIFRNMANIQVKNPFPISEAQITNGVRQVEERIVNEIFVAFKLIHPTAEEVCKRGLPQLGHKFTMGELHKVFTWYGKAVFSGDSIFEFQRMLLEIGAMGRVIPDKSSDVYIQGTFEYTVDHEISISHNDEMCLHPLFSDVFHSAGEQDQPVYPYGSHLDDQDYQL